jgi:hypothetical protein
MDKQLRAVGRTTIKDVSRMAEVSIKTVSRVINNEKYVNKETRVRVDEAMARLGFQPSFAARALAGHRSHQIAVICDNPNPWRIRGQSVGDGDVGSRRVALDHGHGYAPLLWVCALSYLVATGAGASACAGNQNTVRDCSGKPDGSLGRTPRSGWLEVWTGDDGTKDDK